MTATTIDAIRKAVRYWYEQEFAHVNGWGYNVDTTETTDTFSGLYDYKIKVNLVGEVKDETYVLRDTKTNEFVQIRLDGYGQICANKNIVNHDNDCIEPKFESEMLDEFFDEFVLNGAAWTDYDIFHTMFDEDGYPLHPSDDPPEKKTEPDNSMFLHYPSAMIQAFLSAKHLVDTNQATDSDLLTTILDMEKQGAVKIHGSCSQCDRITPMADLMVDMSSLDGKHKTKLICKECLQKMYGTETT